MKIASCCIIVCSALLGACSTEHATVEEEKALDSELSAIQQQIEGDSLLPYFEFDENGNKIEFDFNSSKVAIAKRTAQRSTLILDSVQQFDEKEKEVLERLETDNEYRISIPRPLDYVCRLSLLALNQEYEIIKLKSGEELLSDKLLFEGCEYIGLSCEGECKESGVDDPYLKMGSKQLRKELKQETYRTSETVEIYPYRMIASSFISGTPYIYSSAGSETYFKKRQRVLTWSGMEWRWADFDPDRNGIRAYCYSNCVLDQAQMGWGYSTQAFSCTENMATDLDTWGDTEDITIRCSLSLVVNKIGVKYDNGQMTPQAGGYKLVREYGGGVIGSHFVRHGDNYFKAKTSIGLSADIRTEILNKYSISYR